MYVQDFTGDKDALLDKAFASPKLNPKKNPTIEIALRVVGDTVQKEAIAGLSKEINTDLMDAVAMIEINNGEYSEIPEEGNARDTYESAMDDAIEAALEPWEAHLSANWLGVNTVDTQVWLSTDEDRTIVAKLAESAAKEVFKSLTSDMTPAKVLSNAGIVQADIEARLSANTGDKEVTTETNGTDAVIAKIKAHVGKDFDQLAVFEDVELIVEMDDDVLAASAASRLGITPEEAEVLQVEALNLEDPAGDLVDMIAKYKAPSAASKKAAAKAAKKEAKEAQQRDGLDPIVFSSLKDCGAGDTAMAEALGVSRTTYTNYVKGKTHLEPDEDQYALLRGELVERANKLLAGLAALDGTEAQVVA